MARVAVALLGRQAAGAYHGVLGVLPGEDAALDHADVLVAELAQVVGDAGRAVVGAAMEEEALGAVGVELIDPLQHLGLRDVNRALEVRLIPLVLLADVDQAHAGFDLIAGV